MLSRFKPSHSVILITMVCPLPFLRALLLIALLIWAAPSYAAPCNLDPPRDTIDLTSSRWHWADGENNEEQCVPPVGEWTRAAAGDRELYLKTTGPEGSGRYWTIYLGLSARGHAEPEKGICFTTSTRGWVILRSFPRSPLPWLLDLDQDGNSELILWGDFGLSIGDDLTDTGLMAWVYKFDRDDTFIFDSAGTKKFAHEIAAAYRAPMQSKDLLFQKRRSRIAESIEHFLDGRCEPTPD